TAGGGPPRAAPPPGGGGGPPGATGPAGGRAGSPGARPPPPARPGPPAGTPPRPPAAAHSLSAPPPPPPAAPQPARGSAAAAVAFPVHDTRLVKLEQDDAVLARELAERDGPSVVCLHPEDLDRPEKLRVWGAHGHRVVSAGERRDPQFLGRILRLVRGARRV